MKLGNRIKKFRKDKGLTQIEFAKLLGTTQAVITNYERDLRRPPTDRLPEIAKVLGISLDELYGIKGDSVQVNARISPNARSKQIQDLFEQLPPADQRAVIKHAKGLLRE